MRDTENLVWEESEGVPVGLRPLTPEEIKNRDEERERLRQEAGEATRGAMGSTE